jgi:23S rRNA (pseudouridine1915-N3)-methyltransferase
VKLSVVAVGRVKEAPVRALLDEYRARLTHYVPLRETEIEDGSPDALAARIGKLAKDDALVALDSRGCQYDSHEFARFVETLGRQGKGNVCFALGGKEGLGAPTLDRAGHVLSLGKMTLPHRLARVVLYEQLYRAMTILRGEPYGL